MTTATVAAPRPVAPFSALDHCFYDDGFTVVKRVSADDPYVAGRRAYPGVFVLETLVQAARRCLGAPDLLLAAVDDAPLRDLAPGTVLTLRPDIATTAEGCVITAESMTVRCRRPGPADAVTGVRAARTRTPRSVDPAILLPYGPGLLLDTVSGFVAGTAATAEYTVSATEPCYRDRAPGPYPATLVLESFAQTCQALLRLDRTRATPRHARGVRVHGAVLPGQTLVHEVRLRRQSDGRALLSGQTSAAGRAVLTVDGLEMEEVGTTG
ncbi:hypothetical protein ACTG9Q_05330 [Actinokineospora sp. 24-640]